MTVEQVLRRYRPNGDEHGLDDATAVELLFNASDYLARQPLAGLLQLGRQYGVNWHALYHAALTEAAASHTPLNPLRSFDA